MFHPLPINQYELKEGQIDVWQFSLLELPAFAHYLLDEDEGQRAARFYFPRHRRRFMVARAMLRTLLAKYLDEDPKALSFHYNPYGKPFLKHALPLSFNLSHSGELALLAIGKTWPLGIDVENFSVRPYEDIARNLFSEQEIQALSEAAMDKKQALFFHIWAQKEAFIKACGMGLAYPTQQFSVAMGCEAIEIYDPLEAQTWKMLPFKPGPNAAAALCYHPSVHTLRKSLIDPEEILKT